MAWIIARLAGYLLPMLFRAAPVAARVGVDIPPGIERTVARWIIITVVVLGTWVGGKGLLALHRMDKEAAIARAVQMAVKAARIDERRILISELQDSSNALRRRIRDEVLAAEPDIASARAQAATDNEAAAAELARARALADAAKAAADKALAATIDHRLPVAEIRRLNQGGR